jgi:hypothetical protein
MAVGTGYMAALPTTNTWARDTGPTDTNLYLYDGRGDIVLTFAQSAVVLTQADISALASELDALRDRIRKLERRARSD